MKKLNSYILRKEVKQARLLSFGNPCVEGFLKIENPFNFSFVLKEIFTFEKTLLPLF